VVRDLRDKKMLKALLYWWDPEQHPLAREALRKAGRMDLVGHGARCLVPPETRGRSAERAGPPGGPAANRHAARRRPRSVH
jgi:hypothetical protein